MADIEGRARAVVRLQRLEVLDRVVDALKLVLIIVVLVLIIVVWTRLTDVQASQDRIACFIRQSVKPWKGLEQSFDAPAGDAEARKKALDAIKVGIDATKHLDRSCPAP